MIIGKSWNCGWFGDFGGWRHWSVDCEKLQVCYQFVFFPHSLFHLGAVKGLYTYYLIKFPLSTVRKGTILSKTVLDKWLSKI